ncbi:MAG: 50S ribosomal protein L29 [Candidatus Omnitrophota bacterium]
MTVLKAKDLRNETIEELREKKITLSKELYELRFKAHSGQIEKPHKIKEIRRDIAKLLTVLKEKENVSE